MMVRKVIQIFLFTVLISLVVSRILEADEKRLLTKKDREDMLKAKDLGDISNLDDYTHMIFRMTEDVSKQEYNDKIDLVRDSGACTKFKRFNKMSYFTAYCNNNKLDSNILQQFKKVSKDEIVTSMDGFPDRNLGNNKKEQTNRNKTNGKGKGKPGEGGGGSSTPISCNNDWIYYNQCNGRNKRGCRCLSYRESNPCKCFCPKEANLVDMTCSSFVSMCDYSGDLCDLCGEGCCDNPQYAAANPCECTPNTCACSTYANSVPCTCLPNTCACSTYSSNPANQCECSPTCNSCPAYAQANPCVCSPGTCDCPTYAAANKCECNPDCSCTDFYNENICTCAPNSCQCPTFYNSNICCNPANSDNPICQQVLGVDQCTNTAIPYGSCARRERRNLDSTYSSLPADNRAWGVFATYNSDITERVGKGAGVGVCIVDTGINVGHFEFAGKFDPSQNAKYFRNETSDNGGNTTNPEDGDGHGTHVAGTVAGSTVGVAPDAELYICKALDNNGSGWSSDVDACFSWCCDTSQRPNVRVVNVSLGSDGRYNPNENQEPIFADCRRKGINVFVAAGNSDLMPNIGNPASSPHTIAVGSLKLDSSSNVSCPNKFSVSYFSSVDSSYTSVTSNSFCSNIFDNPNPSVGNTDYVEIATPGSQIWSSVPPNTGGTSQNRNGQTHYYDTYSGTSMATPHASGIAAALISKYEDLGICFDTSNTIANNNSLRKHLHSRATNCDITRNNYGSTGSLLTKTGFDASTGFGFPRIN